MGDPNAGVIFILRRTRPWVRLVSIIGFLSVVLMMVVGLGGGLVGITAERTHPLVLLAYPLFALLYFFPSLYLYKYSRRIGAFVAQGHQAQLESALEAQRAFWQFVGIVTLVGMVVVLCLLIAAIAVGVLAAL